MIEANSARAPPSAPSLVSFGFNRAHPAASAAGNTKDSRPKAPHKPAQALRFAHKFEFNTRFPPGLDASLGRAAGDGRTNAFTPAGRPAGGVYFVRSLLADGTCAVVPFALVR